MPERYHVDTLAAHIDRSIPRTRQILSDQAISAPRQGWTAEELAGVERRLDWSHRNSVKVGADPEFEVEVNGSVAYASRYLSGGVRGRLGTDGASSTGELRPRPGTPEQVAANIRRLLVRAQKSLPTGSELRAGAGTSYPLGGHLHMGGLGYQPSSLLLQKLDEFVSFPLVAKANRNIRGHYQDASQYRQQPHGWEYRTPCSWLAHPDLTKGALAITYVLAQLPDEKLRQITTREQLFEAMGSRREAGEKFYSTLEHVERLERVKVFRAWGIVRDDPPTTLEHPEPREILEEAPPVQDSRVEGPQERGQTRNAVTIAQRDYNMGVVAQMGLTSGRPIIIAGAAAERTEFSAIFIPPSIGGVSTGLEGMYVYRWDREGIIGLSYGLREQLGAGGGIVNRVRSALQQILDRYNNV